MRTIGSPATDTGPELATWQLAVRGVVQRDQIVGLAAPEVSFKADDTRAVRFAAA